MALDLQNYFSKNQDLAQTNATYASTRVVDLTRGSTAAMATSGTAAATLLNRITLGSKPIFFECRVTEAFTTSASGTLRVELVTSASSNLGTPTIILDTGVLAVGALTIGAKLLRAAINGIPLTQRYLGVIYIIGTGAMTAGECDSWLEDTIQTNTEFATA